MLWAIELNNTKVRIPWKTIA